MTDNLFSSKDISKCAMSKEQMYDELDGKMVKCITTKGEGIQLFVVQDVENKKVYFLDEIVRGE